MLFFRRLQMLCRYFCCMPITLLSLPEIMNKPQLLAFFLALFAVQLVSAQCPPGQNELIMEINADEFSYEVHWTIKNVESGITYFTGEVPDSSTHYFTYCIPDNGCTEFQITDEYGDGMQPDGYYKLFLNGVLLHENIGGTYNTVETIKFGCPPGTSCESAFPIDTGAWATPNGAQAWYLFVPADTGIYQINTCDSLNACGSKIWVYNKCRNILISNDPTGAAFYADGGCSNGAIASLLLAGGKEYYIRIRSEPVDCDTLPIHFTLSYSGAIVGCTDPLACNYEPLATISDTCIYPGDPTCPAAPDLVTREDVFRATLNFRSLNNPDACAVEEGCIRGLGDRFIIEFTTYIENIGDQDYHIGTPPEDVTTPSNQFVWDPCHQHWHYLGYADYILFDANGLRIPIGSKTGFCVFDLICPPEDSKYDCINMGISAGCGDVYDIGLPCQWIDITDIPAGDYTLVMRVNWDKSPDKVGRVEKNFENNWAQACFTLTYDGASPDVVFHNESCLPFVDCAGETLGNAQPDCNGICNGPALHGDWTQDTLRSPDDTQAYLIASRNSTGDASDCLDLDDNGSINIYDAALLQECYVHQNEPQYWIQAFPCAFPTGFNNTQDLVSIKPGAVDTIAKTFDIQIINPFNKILGYEFMVSGLIISDVQNLSPDLSPDLLFNAANGKVIGFAQDESFINKNPLPANFLRIHYSALTGTEVCIDSIIAVVNSKYQLSQAMLANPNCVSVKTSSASSLVPQAFGVYVQPNPFTDKTTVYFENETAEPMSVELTDITGKVLRFFEGVRGNSVTFERNNLPSGTYFFTVRGEKGRVSGKIIAQ